MNNIESAVEKGVDLYLMNGEDKYTMFHLKMSWATAMPSDLMT